MSCPLLALAMIVRDDVRGLERALASARSHVDEIDVGIDGRTAAIDETMKLVARFGGTAHVFSYQDLLLTEAEWNRGRMHFSNARNLGYDRLQAPWVIHLDSDEYLETSVDLRALVSKLMFTKYNSVEVWRRTPGFDHLSADRLARSRLRFVSPMHNRLVGIEPVYRIGGISIVEDDSLRDAAMVRNREEQRNRGLELLRPLAEAGDVDAMYHIAKQHACQGNPGEAVPWAKRYLDLQKPRGSMSDHRATLCLAIADQFGLIGEYADAEMWALRALFEGPHLGAFHVLRELARARGDDAAAVIWDKAKELAPENATMRVKGEGIQHEP